MPLAKIHVVEGRYDEDRIAKVSGAVQAALVNTLRVPPDDFYQLIFELPKERFLHTPSFLGLHYTDDLIILDVSMPIMDGIQAAKKLKQIMPHVPIMLFTQHVEAVQLSPDLSVERVVAKTDLMTIMGHVRELAPL